MVHARQHRGEKEPGLTKSASPNRLEMGLDVDRLNAGACRNQPSWWDQIDFFYCLDSYHKSPDSDERQCKSQTSKRRFDLTLRAAGR